MLLGNLGQQSFIDVAYVGRALISVIASATTIAPTSKVTRVTGATAVATITPPMPGSNFVGPIILYSTDASPFTTNTSGNIALATTVVRYKALYLHYDPATSKWYPSY